MFFPENVQENIPKRLRFIQLCQYLIDLLELFFIYDRGLGVIHSYTTLPFDSTILVCQHYRPKAVTTEAFHQVVLQVPFVFYHR